MRPSRPITTFTAAILAAVAGTRAAGQEALADGLYAVFRLDHGFIAAELDFETVPLTAANFVGLAEGAITNSFREPGEPFYDGLTFHRVVPGFVAQGGDPLGTGAGDPGYQFADEFSPRLKHDAIGVLAMANGGPNTNGCQFYFTLSSLTRLDYKHTVFGRVAQGLDVLERIEPGDVINRVEIMRVGDKARAFRPTAESFARLRESTPAIPPRDPELPPLFANDAGLPLPGWYGPWINEKLHHYAAVTGITIRVRSLPHMVEQESQGADETRNPLRAAHERLAEGDTNSATLLLVVAEKRWRLWLGDGLLDRFGLSADAVAGKPGSARLHELKQQILAEARARLEESIFHRSIDAAVANLINALDRGHGADE